MTEGHGGLIGTAAPPEVETATAVDPLLLAPDGPSVVASRPLRMRIVVAVATGCSASPTTMWPLFVTSSVKAKYSLMNASPSSLDIAPSLDSSS